MAWHPFRNIGLKVAALALGALLWYTVSGHRIERRLPVPVFYSNVPTPLELTGDQMDTVNVQVRGDANVVADLTEGRLQVLVDLGAARTGTNIIPLRVDNVSAPSGVEVVMIDPGTVTVTLERTAQIEVAVRPSVEGLPAAGYDVGEIKVEPALVLVAGPESRLKNPISVNTERVILDGRTASVTEDVSVGVSDAQLRVVRPHAVRVTVQISRGNH